MDLYDLYVSVPSRRPITWSEHGINNESLQNFGIIPSGVDLTEAKRLLTKIVEAGARAYLIPIAYRTPAVSLERAKEIALSRHAEIKKTGKKLLPLSDGHSDGLWWTFTAEDEDAIAQDLTPGSIFISVDKIDGSIRTKEQYQRWLALSSIDSASA